MFAIVLEQILKMFVILIVGFIISRIRLIDHKGNVCLSNLLLLVVNPMLLFNSYMIEYTPQRMKAFLISALLAVIVHVAAIVLATFTAGKRNPDYAIERLCMIFSNCGFFGIPLVNAALGSEGVFYLTPFIFVFTVFLWTYGVILMTGKGSAATIIKSLMSPAMIAVLLGLVFFITGLRLPKAVEGGVETLASMNTPLSMLIAGISLAESDLIRALKNKRLYLICFVKLIAVPLISMFLFFVIPGSMDIRYVCLIAAACPVATSGTLFALRYNGNYRYASEMFAVSTVFSMVTIPSLIYLMERISALVS